MIDEKKRRKKTKKPSAMAQVHNRVNAGVMDGVVYGGMMEAAEPEDEEYEIGFEDDANSYAHVVNESTDCVRFGDHYYDCYFSNAIAFMSLLRKDGSRGRIFVAPPGNLHGNLKAYLIGNKEISPEEYGRPSELKSDEKRTGRFWFGHDCNIISFYSYPESTKQIYDNCVEALLKIQEKTGERFNIGEVMVDLWTKRIRNNVIMPVRWFNNGLADTLLPITEKCEPYESFCGTFRYKVVTKKGIFTVDWRGDDVEEEQGYGSLYESKERKETPSLKKYIKSLIDFMREQHLRIDPLPSIELNPEEQDGIFVKTGYYSPDEHKVVVFTDGRHPKDILRTVAHEFIHHMQNLQNPHKDWGTGGDLEADSKLRSIEGEAFLLGNIIFREWTEKMKKTKELNESKKRKKQVKNDKGELVPETCDKCGGKVVCQIHGEPVYVCKDCGKYFGTVPFNLNESPDSISDLDLFYRDEEAIPFMLSRKTGEFYIGHGGETHIEMMAEYLGEDKSELYGSVDDETFGNYVDEERTGRYWPSENIISFWKTPLTNKAKLIDTVSRLSSSVDFDFKRLVIDWWDGNFDSLIPYRWLTNGTFDMLYREGIERVFESGDGVYTAVMTNGQRHNFDASGNFIEPAYSYLEENFDVKKALKKLKKRRDPDNIENWDRLDEIESEIVEPDDVDLSSFNIKKHLNPKFWDNGHLDTRIRLKLLDIADDFFDSLGVDWVEPVDVIITGSLANYNWNKKYSDIDLHILVDYEDVDERVDFVREYFTLKKNAWNEKHKNLRIFGFPVEVYVQDANEPHASSGVYSIDKDKWLTEPDFDKLRSGKVNKKHVREMVSTYMNKIDCLIDIYKKHKDDEYEMRKVAKDASEMFDEIKKLRKDDLDKYKREMCDGNIIFKALRRSDYIGKLIKLKELTYDKINSL